MAKEAIERVLQAEEKAAELVRRATLSAAESVEAAERIAADRLKRERTAAAEALAVLVRNARKKEEHISADAAAEAEEACNEAKSAILNKKGDVITGIINEIKVG